MAGKSDAKLLENESPQHSDASIERWPEHGLEAVSNCPICKGTQRELLHSGLRDRVFRCAPGQWNLYRCTGCGVGYLDPRPNGATIGLAYSRYFTHERVSTVDLAEQSAWRRHRTAQRHAYLNQRYGYELEPAAAHTPWWLRRERRQRWDKYVGFLRYPGKGARLLDVGCGNGRFLMQMRAVGWEVAGVEPDLKSASEAQQAGLDVRVGVLGEVGLPESSFDAVTLNHVIEHFHEPVTTLQQCWRVLKPAGTISIATPNLGSLGHRIFGRDWFALDPPRHLVLFTPGSLRHALEVAGFAPAPKLQLHLIAGSMFRSCMHILRGSDPIRKRPKLPLGLKLKAARLARRADRETLRHPELAEELVMLAHRPSRLG